jgi:CRISPR/Cas system Type II protein with McrA/HNH and RuvC-like nuclease domain
MKKKLRFEVFKRDGFRCCYCGSSTEEPDVILEVDHIEPVSKGGTDVIDNLVTSCQRCNRGKTNVLLSDIPQTLVTKIEEVKKRQEQLKVLREIMAPAEKVVDQQVRRVEKAFQEYYPDREFTDTFRRGSVRQFLEHVPAEILVEYIHRACLKVPDDPSAAIKYFCGIYWKVLKGRQE